MNELESAINTQIDGFLGVVLGIAGGLLLLACAVGGLLMFFGVVDQQYRQKGKEAIIWSFIAGAVCLAVKAAM